MLKALFAIGVLQTVALLFLSSRVIMLEDEVANYRTDSPAIIDLQTPHSARSSAVSVSALPSENRLREIIGEELASQLDGIAFAGAADESKKVREQGPAYEQRRQSVAQSVDYYVSIGAIGQQDMWRLQQEIAHLNPDDRKVMMSKLVRAMNNGKLDGRF
jgi:hypothetical protein